MWIHDKAEKADIDRKYFPPTEEDIPKESEDAEDAEKKEVSDKAEDDGKVKKADPGAVKEEGTTAEADQR